jgi:enamine deaminase RidA (YjgF/YER057c/UK114 family)
MIRFSNPPGAVQPPSRYSQIAVVPAGGDYVFLSGQIGIREDGSIPSDVVEQIELTWRHIETLLGAEGLTLADVVKVNGFLTSIDHVAAYKQVRDRLMPEPPPASTVVLVSGFVAPGLLVEIDVIAVRP